MLTIEARNALYSSLPNITNIPNISNLWDKDANSDTSILTNSQYYNWKFIKWNFSKF